MKANRSAHGIAAACTLRSWLGMWSLRHRADPGRAAPGPHQLSRPGHQRRAGHRRLSLRRAAHLRCAGEHRQDAAARSTPTTTSPPPAPAASRPIRSPSGSRNGGDGEEARSGAAHFTPGDKVLDFLAPEADWLDVRYCAEDDDETFYRELPDAEVIWHVLRPLSGDDLERATRCRLVHKLGAGVNTIDVDAATRLGIAVANMPGANAPSVAEGTVLLMLAALRRLPALDRATRAGRGLAVGSEPRRDRPRHRRLHGRAGRLRQRRQAGRDDRRRDGRRRCCTPAPATTAPPAGGRCRTCSPPATSSRCTCRSPTTTVGTARRASTWP